MEGRCELHLFDRAVDLCGRCGGEFCNTCVVYPFGPKKAPFCLGCAVVAAGVRKGAGYAPPLSRKERKRLDKVRLASAEAAAADTPAETNAFDLDWMKQPSPTMP